MPRVLVSPVRHGEGDQTSEGRACHHRATVGDRLQRMEQEFGGAILRDVSQGACVQVGEGAGIVCCAQHKNRYHRKLATDHTHYRQAIVRGPHGADQHDSRLQCGDLCGGLATTPGIAYHYDTCSRPQHSVQSMACGDLILHDQDKHHPGAYGRFPFQGFRAIYVRYCAQSSTRLAPACTMGRARMSGLGSRGAARKCSCLPFRARVPRKWRRFSAAGTFPPSGGTRAARLREPRRSLQ